MHQSSQPEEQVSSPSENDDEKDVCEVEAPLSPMQRFRRYGLRVTDLSDQLWCEQRLAWSLARGKEETPEMKQGKARHQELHEEITEVVRVRPDSRADLWMLHFFNAWSALVQLERDGICREIPVFGQVGPFWILGIIDQMVRADEGHLVLSDTKTRKRASMPTMAQKRTTQMQMMVYHHLWTQLAQGVDASAIFTSIGLPLNVEASPAFLEQLQSHHIPTPQPLAMLKLALEAFAHAPALSPEMQISYEWQQDQSLIGVDAFSFNATWFQRKVAEARPFWEGERQPLGVLPNEGWKCRFCDFASECSVRPH